MDAEFKLTSSEMKHIRAYRICSDVDQFFLANLTEDLARQQQAAKKPALRLVITEPAPR